MLFHYLDTTIDNRVVCLHVSLVEFYKYIFDRLIVEVLIIFSV